MYPSGCLSIASVYVRVVVLIGLSITWEGIFSNAPVMIEMLREQVGHVARNDARIFLKEAI